VQLVIDDVGRRVGIKARGPVYRRPPVIERLMTAEDYDTIANIGEASGMRPQTAMELWEWDRGNVCARYPTTQWMGSAGDNSEAKHERRILPHVRSQETNTLSARCQTRETPTQCQGDLRMALRIMQRGIP